MTPKDKIDLLISILTFFTTIIIAYILHKSSIKNTTLAALNTLRENIKEIDYELSRKFGVKDISMADVDAENQNDNNKTSWEIKYLLNEYEQLAAAINHGLLSERIAKISRENVLVYTYDHYLFFIENWRQSRMRPNAWKQLEILAMRWKKKE
jgi:hypothetical protein